ncbi:C-type lectin domain family 4 member F isoform X1 [Sardina pilchardus]|uniref:C-type lectin domain family 4 member F isoform X1 n=1 Tax=Sardina pilchardus TaxID=27697 RepID=UPI002E0E893E
MEMTEAIIERNDDEENTQDLEIHTRLKLATMCFGVLCVILLVVIISFKSHSSNNASYETFQQQTLDNLTHEIVQLQSRYNNLTIDRDLVQTLFYNLTLQKSQLEDKFNNVTKEKDILQTLYDYLNTENSQLQSRYNNLTRERDELRSQRDVLVSRRIKDGWIRRNTSLYKISITKKSWGESRKFCLKMGTDLVIVNDENEQQFIAPYKNHWIGLSDTEEEGVWRWVDGTVLTNPYWAPGEPNDDDVEKEGGEDCAEISSDATDFSKAWNDMLCSTAFQYICEDHI